MHINFSELGIYSLMMLKKVHVYAFLKKKIREGTLEAGCDLILTISQYDQS